MSEPAADRRFMAAALALASRGLGNTWPNPSVGCVIVKDGLVVGRGWTQPGGRPHAETEAVNRAGAAARGATAYVTLEPCSHHGQTGPCVEALISAGIARVVAAIVDPDLRVSGKGLVQLQAAGIAVETGVMAEEAEALNEGYLKRTAIGRPMVTLKLAATLDGRIACHNGDSQWITDEPARAMAHGLRATHDAIAVGNGTVSTDNPHLTCRLPGLPVRPPVRIVYDSRLQLPLTRQLITTAHIVPTWIVTLVQTVEEAAAERAEALEDMGVVLIPVEADVNGRISVAKSLQALGDIGLTRLMVEGGGKLAASFLAERLVDRLALFRGPSVIGGDGIAAIGPLGLQRVADAPGFELADFRKIGQDTVENYKRR
jgi:diaminohydroxyphosphoribosylaminopyrimidine deaminase/5-amino-6-(5-phosphoribosylamino)uracil reductase